MKRQITTLILACSIHLTAQNPINIYESTLKINGSQTEEYLCGFTEGDKLIFNFEVIKGKELKEIEILEYPFSSIYMNYKTAKIIDKLIDISHTGIYRFRFTNSAITGRICKIKIQRIPANERTVNFNTTVYWNIVYDTTYNDVAEKYLINTDTVINNITDQIAKVHSATSPEGHNTSINFTLPANTIAWSYYIGVGQEGQKAFSEATQKLAQTASPLLSIMPGYGPLAALALGGVSYLTSLQSGENVKYWIVDSGNLSLINANQPFKNIKHGDVINDFSNMTFPLKGQYFLCLQNDNNFQAIDVTVKITAVCAIEHWGTRSIKKMIVNKRTIPYLKN